MPLKYKQFFGVAVLLFATVGTAHAQSKDLSSSGVLLDRVAAVVNDGLVLRSALRAGPQPACRQPDTTR